MTQLSHTSITALIEQAMKAQDPHGLAALLEWVAVMSAIAEMTHIFGHVEKTAMETAVAAAKACTGTQGGTEKPLH